ncbi:MAG: DUF1704 domain-containing protein, partial [Flavobacteriaceae bacterium]|nr:DUF1704 domain-containing protein [Flavobacteriaceae bacterium]
LKGLKRIYNYAKAGGDLDNLLIGKMSMDYSEVVKKLQDLGLAKSSKFFTDSYLSNDNQNTNLDFILKSLK